MLWSSLDIGKEALMERERERVNLRDHVMELFGHWKGSSNGERQRDRERERDFHPR
jgi:hypothetical protein